MGSSRYVWLVIGRIYLLISYCTFHLTFAQADRTQPSLIPLWTSWWISPSEVAFMTRDWILTAKPWSIGCTEFWFAHFYPLFTTISWLIDILTFMTTLCSVIFLTLTNMWIAPIAHIDRFPVCVSERLNHSGFCIITKLMDRLSVFETLKNSLCKHFISLRSWAKPADSSIQTPSTKPSPSQINTATPHLLCQQKNSSAHLK